MIPRVSLREALSDPNLLGTAIAGDSWRSWRVLLIAAMGEGVIFKFFDDEEMAGTSQDCGPPAGPACEKS